LEAPIIVNADFSPAATIRQRRHDSGTNWLVVIVTLLSLAAFLYPFRLAGVASLCLVVLLTQLGPSRRLSASSAKVAALLGAVIALDASLRLLPSLGGASPVFLLIILAGSAFGAQLGFLTGALTLLLSAFLTGGIGPWLPFQMIGAGWIGLAAAWIPRPRSPQQRPVGLILYGIGSGFLYGALLNLYSWPFAAPGLDETATLFWHPGLGLTDTIQRYASFYLVTSFSHDALRALGNGVLLLTLGPPLLTTLTRARRRLSWQPAPASRPAAPRHQSLADESAVH
jgi:energy-coupling factor transport system substrate-specific component